MEITCAQMDVLISFYLEGDLSSALKTKVEEHLKTCSTCRAKYDIIKTLLCDLKGAYGEKEEICASSSGSSQYKVFKNNLSAYVDNELPSDENIKIKKFTINNPQARKELEDAYSIRKLMNDSFRKTHGEAKQDFSKNVIRELNPNEDFGIHPVLRVAVAFVMTVLVLSSIIIFSLTL